MFGSTVPSEDPVSKHRRFYFDVNIFDIEVIALYTFAMAKDIVDEMLDQWARERPELDASPLSVAVRVQMLGRRFRRDAERFNALLDIGRRPYQFTYEQVVEDGPALAPNRVLVLRISA